MSDYRVVNPATGQVESEFATATDAEIEAALERSHAAYAAWARRTVAERAAGRCTGSPTSTWSASTSSPR